MLQIEENIPTVLGTCRCGYTIDPATWQSLLLEPNRARLGEHRGAAGTAPPSDGGALQSDGIGLASHHAS